MGLFFRKKLAFSCLVFFMSCLSEDVNYTTLPLEPQSEKAHKENTIIIYINADNNLDSFSLNDIHEIEKGFNTNSSHQYHSNNYVLVYWDRASGATPDYSVIFEVGNDPNPQRIDSKIVSILGEKDSSSSNTLKEVLDFSFKNYPANNYSLIVWSHGTGWLPLNSVATGDRLYKGGKYPTKTFGLDYTSSYSEMPIKGFVGAISNSLSSNAIDKLNYVIFDACYMGDVEVAFELRNYTDYILSSQTEIMVEGMPYDTVLPFLLESNPSNLENNLKKVINAFKNYYNNQTIPYKTTAQMSLVKTAFLEELAVQLKSYITNNITIITNQVYLTYTTSPTLVEDYVEVKHDLMTFFDESSESSSYGNRFIRDSFINTFNKVVIYNQKNKSILNSISSEKIYGLNTYIPIVSKTNLNNYYKTLDWYAKSGFNFYFQ